MEITLPICNLQSEGVDNLLSMITYNTTATSGNRIWAYRARGTQSAPVNIALDDELLSIIASGKITTAFSQAAAIRFLADGTPGTGAPGRIEFQTAPSTSTTLSTRMTIDSDGVVNINNLSGTHAGGQAYVVVNDAGDLIAQETPPTGPIKNQELELLKEENRELKERLEKLELLVKELVENQ